MLTSGVQLENSKTDSVQLSSLDRALLCAKPAQENRGRDVVILDLRKLTQVVDFFIVATGASRRQIHTIADEIDRVMNEQGDEKIGIEGYDLSRWTLVDYGDIVIHVFDEETRAYYDIENLWGDAELVPVPEK